MADSTLRPPTAARISPDTVRQAAQSLLKWKSTKSLTENPNLLADEEFFYLNLTLKKIPPKARVNPYKIPLPHPLHLASETELCLIIDDREKSKLTKGEVKKKVEADDIGVGKVLKFSKLRTDYVAFEAKRKLCDSYDMFLVDKRLVPLLPKLIGKQFYKKKKIPLVIDLSHKNWKEQIGRAIGSCLLYLRTGTCCVVKVARVSMELEEIVENVMAAVKGIVEIVPKKWDGVRSFHLKLSESLSLPIYQALPDLKLKISGVEKVEEDLAEEEVVNDNGKIDETVKTKKKSKKGTIPEVNYMKSVGGEDDNGNVESDDAPDVDEVPVKKRKKSTDKLEKAVGATHSKKERNSVKKDDSTQNKKASSKADEVAGEKNLKIFVKGVKGNAKDAEDKVAAKKSGMKKLRTEETKLKDKKKSRVPK